jgi:hypothetical protein
VFWRAYDRGGEVVRAGPLLERVCAGHEVVELRAGLEELLIERGQWEGGGNRTTFDGACVDEFNEGWVGAQNHWEGAVRGVHHFRVDGPAVCIPFEQIGDCIGAHVSHGVVDSSALFFRGEVCAPEVHGDPSGEFLAVVARLAVGECEREQSADEYRGDHDQEDGPAVNHVWSLPPGRCRSNPHLPSVFE